MGRVAKSSVEISTSAFEFAHGRKPRGDGWWIFTGGKFRFEVSATWGEATRQARAFFAERGVRQARVES